MQIEARNLSVEDYDGLVETMKRALSHYGRLYLAEKSIEK